MKIGKCTIVWKIPGGNNKSVKGMLRDVGDKFHIHPSGDSGYYIVPKESVINIRRG